MTSDMIEVATGLSDVDQQVDDEGPPDSEKHANLTVHTIACMAMVSLWPFHQHIKLGVGTCAYIHTA